MPQWPRCKAWVPARPAVPEALIKLIRVSNPDLPTRDWRIAKLGEVSRGKRKAVLILNRDSLPILEEGKGRIKLGFTAVTLQVYSAGIRI